MPLGADPQQLLRRSGPYRRDDLARVCLPTLRTRRGLRQWGALRHAADRRGVSSSDDRVRRSEAGVYRVERLPPKR